MARLAWPGSFFRIEIHAWVWFPRFFHVCQISSPILATRRRSGRRSEPLARAHVSCDWKARGSYVGGGHWRHDCTLGLVHTTSTTQAKDGTTPIQAQKCARCNERLMEGDIAQSHASCGDVPSSWNAIDLEDGGVPHLVQDRTKGQAVDQCTQYQEVNLERARSITGTTTRSPTMKESWWLSCGHL